MIYSVKSLRPGEGLVVRNVHDRQVLSFATEREARKLAAFIGLRRKEYVIVEAPAMCERCTVRAADPTFSTPGYPRCGKCEEGGY